VHQVGFYYTDVSRCTVNKTLKKKRKKERKNSNVLSYLKWTERSSIRHQQWVTATLCHSNGKKLDVYAEAEWQSTNQ